MMFFHQEVAPLVFTQVARSTPVVPGSFQQSLPVFIATKKPRGARYVTAKMLLIGTESSPNGPGEHD